MTTTQAQQQALTAMRREACIICPITEHTIIRHVEAMLADAFGGFSVYSGHGAWRNYDGKVISEANFTYIIAMLNRLAFMCAFPTGMSSFTRRVDHARHL
jgi:hypothetical protein